MMRVKDIGAASESAASESAASDLDDLNDLEHPLEISEKLLKGSAVSHTVKLVQVHI